MHFKSKEKAETGEKPTLDLFCKSIIGSGFTNIQTNMGATKQKKAADVESGGAAAAETTTNNNGSRSSMKQKCCGSPSRIFCSTLLILIIIIAIVMIAVYGTRTGIPGGKDETHTSGTLGTCAEGFHNQDSVNILTLNTFMIYCVPGTDALKCQEAEARTERAKSIGKWFQDKDYDVILLQEIWSNHEVIRDGMAEAGFCHYVMTEKSAGSGLGVFSKYPILEHSFKDWFDGFASGGSLTPDPMNPESWIADKGVLYAKVIKNNQPVHIFNLHANSDSVGDYHDVRVKQFEIVNKFIESKDIPTSELVLIGGDMNEDKDCRMFTCDRQANCEDQSYYNEMLTTLSAGEVEVETGDTNPWTYNTEENAFLKSLYEGEECSQHQYLLDYIFYSNKHQKPGESSVCRVLNPLSEDGKDLSDHFPLDCVIDFSTTEPATETVTDG